MSENYKEDSQFLNLLNEQLEQERNARAELSWQIETRPVDPLIEGAAKRQLPPGHIAFIGDLTLRPHEDEL